jgi:hypothetical protein
MVDLRPQLRPVLAAALREMSGRTHGVVLQIVASRKGDGVSTVARSLALAAAETAARGVWLIDLDLWSNAQFEAFAAAHMVQAFGPPGSARDANLNAPPFWRAAGATDPRHLVTLHRIGQTRLFVSRCRVESVHPGDRLQIAPAPDYWSAARRAADLVVIDTPCAERSKVGLATAALADGVILVVDAESADVSDAVALRDEILAQGGRILGVFVNRARKDSALLARLAG